MPNFADANRRSWSPLKDCDCRLVTLPDQRDNSPVHQAELERSRRAGDIRPIVVSVTVR